MTAWYAISHEDGSVVTTGASWRECSDKALALTGWIEAGEHVAPYYLTTIAPKEDYNDSTQQS